MHSPSAWLFVTDSSVGIGWRYKPLDQFSTGVCTSKHLNLDVGVIVPVGTYGSNPLLRIEVGTKVMICTVNEGEGEGEGEG